MKRQTIKVTVNLESYIAHPYWPEREETIAIERNSGMNRQKSEEKRQTALLSELDKRGIEFSEYEEMKARAERPFYRVNNDDESSPIVIPRHHIAGAFVETLAKSPKNLRGPYDKDNFRHLCRISDWVTNKTEADGVFDRYVKLDTSNMRNRQQNPYIKNVTCSGTLEILETHKPEDVQRLLRAAIELWGVGACRKMGYGRGEIKKFDV